MPIKIPNNLPAGKQLADEGLYLISEKAAARQDIRPLNIALLNLMPLKQVTEIQLARLVGATPLQIHLTLLTTQSYRPNNVSAQHLNSFYKSWHDIKHEKYDGLIVTGAPVETMPFEQVGYWSELCEILSWSQTHVHSSFFICWGAQAALHHFYQIPKHPLKQKLFGVYPHRIHHRQNPFLLGFSDAIHIPVSRYTETRSQDIKAHDNLEILIDSEQAGLCLVEDRVQRNLYMLNHLEYDANTLKEEYERDQQNGVNTAMPYGYFDQDDISKPPLNRWRSHAHLLFANWINQTYQNVPFARDHIGNI